MLSNFDGLAPGDAFPRARVAAERALALDSTLAEAHTALALVAMNYDRDWDRAEREFQRARMLNPSFAEAARLHALFLLAMGRGDEALREIDLARRDDPLWPTIATHRGWVLMDLGRLDEAIDCLGRVEPLRGQALLLLGNALMRAGRVREGLARLESDRDEEDASSLLSALAAGYAQVGRREEASRMLTRLEALPRSQSSPMDRARAQLAVGHRDRALADLEQAYDERFGPLMFLGSTWDFDALRGTPRFDTLMAHMRYPATTAALYAARSTGSGTTRSR
jgi:tetratricopeptide (TPR) repeat protein